ncbi:hypothetical protein D3C71_1090170 [compost metagenome]
MGASMPIAGALRAVIAQRQAAPLQHHLRQLPFADRFGQVVVHAALQQRAFFVGHGVGSEGHDRQRRAMAFAFPLADRLGALATVHAGHLHVHQHQIECLVLHRLDGGITAFHREYLGAHVFEQGLHQHQVGRIVVDAKHLRGTAGYRFARLAAHRPRVDQVRQGASQLAGAGRFSLELAVGVGHGKMEQRLFRGRAQHQHFAAKMLEVPDVLVEAFRRHVVTGDAEHGEVDRLVGLVGGGDAIGQAFQGIERCGAEAAVFQLMLQRLPCQLVVFQYRHPSPEQGCRGQVFGIVAGFWQAQADPEFRPFPRRAVDADLTAHLFDQALGNHQAQASTAGLPRQRVVGLAEGLEQGAHVLVGQTDAGVLDADAQLHAVFVLFFEHGAGDDGAFAGELDRVAHQVRQNLLEPQRVAHQ